EIPHGGVLIGELVGIACQAIGRRDLWGYADHLDGAQARAAAQRLEGIMARHFSFADTLQEEKWTGQAGLMEVFRRADWRDSLNSAMSDPGGQGGQGMLSQQKLSELAQNVQLLFYGKSRILQNYTRYMDQTIANARQPYAAKLAAPPV